MDQRSIEWTDLMIDTQIGYEVLPAPPTRADLAPPPEYEREKRGEEAEWRDEKFKEENGKSAAENRLS